MFEFEDIIRSDEGVVLAARCRLDQNCSFFEGHFEGQPLMAAAAQLQMIDALIRLDGQYGARISGGNTLKFVQQIRPGDTIDLLLRHRSKTMIEFSIQKQDASLVTKGTLILMRDDIDN